MSEGKGDQTNTLFVRNVPFDATAAQLEEAFSEIGPVRKCYIVTDAGKKTSRGFAYVHVSTSHPHGLQFQISHSYSVCNARRCRKSLRKALKNAVSRTQAQAGLRSATTIFARAKAQGPTRERLQRAQGVRGARGRRFFCP
jgi:RNA recognition motif-containing protein